MNFPNEEAREKAFNELPESATQEQLDEIRNAQIGDGTPEKPPETPPETPPEKPPVETKEPDKPAEPDYAGHKSVDDLVKGHRELEDTFGRQTKKFREVAEQLDSMSRAAEEAKSRADRLESEIAELKKSGTPAPQGTTKDVKSIRSELSGIASKIDQLEAKAESDPEAVFDAGYQKELRSLTRLQTQKMSDLADLLEQASAGIAETKQFTKNFTEKQELTKEEEKHNEIRESIYKAIDTLDDEEYKLPRGAKEAEGEYIKWVKDIAFAYYGRPARNRSEEFTALDQLQFKNPDLLKKCAEMGAKTEPSDEVARYMKNAELLDYMDGFRKDPVTGQFKRLTKFDPVSGHDVPIVYSDMKSALQALRLENGYYQKKAEDAYQNGATDVANVAMRRDKGAVTLDGGTDQGQTPGGSDLAEKILIETDPEQAMIEYRQGNTAKFDEIQKARAILKMDPIVFE